MRLQETRIQGSFVVLIEPREDERGLFARTHCEDELAAYGLVGRFRQSSVSFNARHGTVRGMHYSVGPSAETKLVRCTSGAVHDVLVDLRRDSPTYMRTDSVMLSADNRRSAYVPAGVAHGFQALRDGSEVLYMIDERFQAEAARGVRWDDPSFAIEWPERISVIAQRDLEYPDWTR